MPEPPTGADPTLELLEQAGSGSERALRVLYEAHRPRVVRLAYALLGDAGEAEDIAQDVLVYALTHLDRYYPNRAAFTTWLHMITVSRCRDRARRKRLELERFTAWWRANVAGAGVREGAERAAARLDASAAVGRALHRLTPLQREAIVLREIEGLTFEELGRVLGVPLRTAQARVTSAHAALRRALDDAGAVAPPAAGAVDKVV